MGRLNIAMAVKHRGANPPYNIPNFSHLFSHRIPGRRKKEKEIKETICPHGTTLLLIFSFIYFSLHVLLVRSGPMV